MANVLSASRFANLWSETDKALYHQLPIYLAKMQVDLVPMFQRWPKLLKAKNWEPNVGNIMRGVRKDKPAVLRNQEVPNPITQLPTKDVIEVREVHEDVQLYRKDFESNIFHFLPSFQDFLTDHVDAHNEAINEKQLVYADQFYRTAIFHGSPSVWRCGPQSGTELVGSAHWTQHNITLAKDQATLQDMVSAVTKPITVKMLAKLATVMMNDIGAAPFSGKVLPDGTNGEHMRQKFCLICGSEVWDYFQFDAFVNGAKNDSMDIVTDVFTGSPVGRFVTMIERFELRIASDGTVPAPQTTEENPNAYDYGRAKPNPAYVDAEFGVAFILGAESYKNMKVGAPPKDWRGTSMNKFNQFDWNGKVRITDNVLTPGLDPDGALVYDTNKRGEYIQLISDLALGIMPIARYQALPIIYRRTRVNTDD